MDIPLAQISPALLGLVGSLLAGLMNGVGAVPVLFGRVPSREMRDMALGFAAGVMLSASFFSLIIPALDAAAMRYGESAAPAAIACLGILIGMAAVAALNEVLPHEHFQSGREGPEAGLVRRIWLFVAAITIQNLPEGLAVGVGFGAEGFKAGLPLAIGIGLQNAPEGLAVAVALLGLGYSRWHAFAVAALTGMIEPVGGMLGAGIMSVSRLLLHGGSPSPTAPCSTSSATRSFPRRIAAGIRGGRPGLAVGLVLMLFLDVWLG